MSKFRLLNFYEQRVPADVRDLFLSYYHPDKYEIRSTHYGAPLSEQKERMAWADGVLLTPGRKLPEEVIAEAKRAQLFQLWSSGYDKFSCDLAEKYGVPTANNGGANSQSVAEHTFALLLSICRRVPQNYQKVLKADWSGGSHGMDMWALSERTIGIIGLGHIGSKVAKIAHGFGMNILYNDVERKPQAESDLGAKFVELDRLIERSDVLTVHVHFSTQTRGLLNRERLGRMKQNSILISISRADLIDYDALLEFLNSGKIWAAGLDVFHKEPNPPGDPLINHPRVIATPHLGGSTRQALEKSAQNCQMNFDRLVAGEAPEFIVAGPERKSL